ncbi:MAG: CRISPR-associated helicase Cas3' [Thermoprotei archaeon]|nr:MAG: CRISPR-associated helicase Cas3' [Thermoprotei archaeon]
MRKLCKWVCMEAEKALDEGYIPQIIFISPTAYGKTVLSPYFHAVLKERELAYSHIHVMPTRALVENLFLKIMEGKDPRLLEGLRRAEIPKERVYYQHMGFIRGYSEYKNPWFKPGFIISTADSFFYTYFGIPVPEIDRKFFHSLIPFASLVSSSIVLDETHLLVEKELQPAFLALLKLMTCRARPFLFISATVPNTFLDLLLKGHEPALRLPSKVRRIVVSYGEEEDVTHSSENYVKIIGRDEAFERSQDVEWKTEIIARKELEDRVLSEVESGKSVLIVRNKVAWTYETWERLSGLLEKRGIPVFFLTSKMTFDERYEQTRRLREMSVDGKVKEGVLVATSCVEVGLDLSFGSLFSDAAPLPPLIQRAGRVARRGEKEGQVFILEPEKDEKGNVKSRPYRKVEFEASWKKLRRAVIKESEMEWRLPTRSDVENVYNLLEQVYSLDDVKKEYLGGLVGGTHRRHGKYSSLLRIALDLDKTSKHLRKLQRDYSDIVRDMPLLTIVVADETIESLLTRDDITIRELWGRSFCISKKEEHNVYKIASHSKVQAVKLDFTHVGNTTYVKFSKVSLGSSAKDAIVISRSVYKLIKRGWRD